MPIVPLPVFEEEVHPKYRSVMSDEEIYARLEAPKTIVVRYGHLKFIGEFPYNGDAKPGCGSRLIARTHRGTEVAEMLTTTCSNSGCGKSVSRREVLDYIENSGGKEYPFYTNGRVIRVATIEDLNQQSALETVRREGVKAAKAHVTELQLPMKVVEAEPILGGECMTFYYMSEARVDFRELVTRLAAQFGTRIEMRQVGARDEARLVADYERCGQHCCCKNFLKVLKPVSMRQAKVQKATLDPLKISGRCGRLMCCLRYEDQTYKELKSRLPNKSKRVGTSEGPGVVVDSKILVQLVLVRLEHDLREIAVPVEELMDPDTCPRPRATAEPEPRERPHRTAAAPSASGRGALPSKRIPPQAAAESSETPADPLRGMEGDRAAERVDDGQRQRKKRRRRRKRAGGAPSQELTTPSEPTQAQQQDAFRRMAQETDAEDDESGGEDTSGDRASDAPSGPINQTSPQPDKRKRRRRRRRRKPHGDGPPPGAA